MRGHVGWMRKNSSGGATVVVIVGDAISASWKGMMCGVLLEGSVVVDGGSCKVGEGLWIWVE